MIQEISVGIVVLGAAYWILRKVLRHLAGEDVTGGCQGCSACSVPQAHRPASVHGSVGACGPGVCPSDKK